MRRKGTTKLQVLSLGRCIRGVAQSYTRCSSVGTTSKATASAGKSAGASTNDTALKDQDLSRHHFSSAEADKDRSFTGDNAQTLPLRVESSDKTVFHPCHSDDSFAKKGDGKSVQNARGKPAPRSSKGSHEKLFPAAELECSYLPASATTSSLLNHMVLSSPCSKAGKINAQAPQ